MENYYLVNILIIAKAIKFTVLFNKQVTVKDIKLYRLKISSLIYLAI